MNDTKDIFGNILEEGDRIVRLQYSRVETGVRLVMKCCNSTIKLSRTREEVEYLNLPPLYMYRYNLNNAFIIINKLGLLEQNDIIRNLKIDTQIYLSETTTT